MISTSLASMTRPRCPIFTSARCQQRLSSLSRQAATQGSQCGPSHNKGRQAVSKEITMLKGVLITARAFAFAAFAAAVTGLRRNGRSSEV
jgi:hypothetical protein